MTIMLLNDFKERINTGFKIVWVKVNLSWVKLGLKG